MSCSSGVARVPCALGQEIFLRAPSIKSLKWLTLETNSTRFY